MWSGEIEARVGKATRMGPKREKGGRGGGLTLSWTTESLGRRTVRKLSERGQMGVSTRLCTEGCTIGPPADSE